jgi:hypothetical protein
MRTLSVLEQKQISGGIITEFTYDFVEPDEDGQMFLHVHLKGDEADIRGIIRELNPPADAMSE